ncbi:tyrosine-type recombinase/integrase [Clostridium tyrobutyricum]|jgi:integrase|uniref:tyrosine-type recombinase/integrase n=1 Tax=Clostridium tyrobutyricum TaxID=1519 RepID=UPI0018A068FA|nr:tyrosine-type recombinase/integrase [Clostridium tyrobutyricum]
MNTAFKPTQSETKLLEINSKIYGYWQNDVWDIHNVAFEKLLNVTPKSVKRYIDFSSFPRMLKNEVKFFILNRFESNEITYRTIIKNYCSSFKQVADFLEKYYPFNYSFVEISLDKALIQLRLFLADRNIKLRNCLPKSRFTRYETLLNQICSFYTAFYDTRNEYEKDIWDIRKIASDKVIEHTSHYLLNFTGIPKPFINTIKRYIKYRLSYLSHGQCRTDIMGIKLFLIFINAKYPSWIDITQLSREDIENYITWFNDYTKNFKGSKTAYFISLHTFIENIQRFDYKEAPKTPIAMLIFKEDFPKHFRWAQTEIKYIPEDILLQLENNLKYLNPSEYIPVVILLRASGWRISDILYLKYDTCLERTSQGWYLHGDILKTRVLNHRVPITDEVANVVKTIVETVKSKSTIENNPKKFLFARFFGRRKGHTYGAKSISESLNSLAKKRKIVDQNGQIFHFKNHAFRHTKGIELINNGMNLLHVQKWMAHASPEMTLTYAKILDTTMRKSWENATKQGLFRVDDTGNFKKIDISEIENEDIIEWEYIRHNLDAVRMPLGYCMKPKKQECHTQLNPCLTCRNLCTTPDFIPEFEIEIQETKAVIERGKAQKRSVWIEKNQVLLEKYESILEVLKQGKIHHMAGKKGREYIGEEKNNV